VGIGQRMQLLLFGFAVQPRALTAVALGCLEYCAPLLVGVHCALYACHGSVPIRSGRTGLGGCQPLSSFLTRLVSLAATSVRPSSRRVRFDALCSSKCRRLAFWRTIFPAPVARNRFEAPLWVFALGICPQFCGGVSVGASSGCARCATGASASCAALARVFAPRCGASTIVMLRPSCLADVSTKP